MRAWEFDIPRPSWAGATGLLGRGVAAADRLHGGLQCNMQCNAVQTSTAF